MVQEFKVVTYRPLRELYSMIQELSGKFNLSDDILVFFEDPQDSEHSSVHYTIPYASIARATFINPAILAPAT